MKIDADADAAYLRLSRSHVARTRRFEGSESILIKLDGEHRPVGIEVIGLSTELPIDRLAQAYNFSPDLMIALKEAQKQLRQAAGREDV